MIPLKQIDGTIIDLSVSEKFVDHYNNPSSFAKQIIENEINAGLWYDEILFNLPDDSIIIDVGANVGLWSLYMLPKAKEIFCIEPTKEHFEVMRGLAQKLKAPFLCDNVALWKTTGSVKFVKDDGNSTCNKVGSFETVFYDTITAVTLNTFLEENNIGKVDLLKLDIEGAEHEVILEDETIGEALSKCRIVYIETHPHPYGHADENAIIQKMISLGFAHKKAAREMSHYFTK